MVEGLVVRWIRQHGAHSRRQHAPTLAHVVLDDPYGEAGRDDRSVPGQEVVRGE